MHLTRIIMPIIHMSNDEGFSSSSSSLIFTRDLLHEEKNIASIREIIRRPIRQKIKTEMGFCDMSTRVSREIFSIEDNIVCSVYREILCYAT
jgi:uncharacterized protein YggT (Ycf19 family)